MIPNSIIVSFEATKASTFVAKLMPITGVKFSGTIGAGNN